MFNFLAYRNCYVFVIVISGTKKVNEKEVDRSQLSFLLKLKLVNEPEDPSRINSYFITFWHMEATS